MEHVTRTWTESGEAIDWWVVEEADDEPLLNLGRRAKGFGFQQAGQAGEGFWIGINGAPVINPDLIAFLNRNCRSGTFSEAAIPQLPPDAPCPDGAVQGRVVGELTRGVERGSEENRRRKAWLIARVTGGGEPSEGQIEGMLTAFRAAATR
ncbi:hypothetical protein SAMN05660831_00047 [Thiohalospira halophila DSM 15071]|uniref:Uncharacterized protein n=1 Tax=Thiohalospira halophila DSM 15071 TaxID=1123397 RepID=A0A1I1MZV4_9GAMM|nr:hypothetical protein [Thiohalospira halophila]SFC90917.1 hypothetical protein SAMN05660831_00047 [Thiohalospira halophila DSM 15071]